MKKKLLAIILSCTILLAPVGCGAVSPDGNQFGDFVRIEDSLCYDPATRIVYIDFYGGGFCPYYAPNVLPYKYNPETNTFEEIVNN